MKRPERTPARLSEALFHRLNAYALAASAAGVGVLALTGSAEAKIVYTKTHKVLQFTNPAQSLSLDLNNDGVSDFKLVNAWFDDEDFGPTLWFYIVPARRANGAEGHTVNFGTQVVSALSGGAKIGQNDRFLSNTIFRESMCHATDYSHTDLWCNDQNRYVGLRFSIKGRIHYGWARLNAVLGNNAFLIATLTGYAYETVPGKAIVAGRTKGGDVSTAESGTLGRLAAGAAGVDGE
jgi:hypothetical protein